MKEIGMEYQAIDACPNDHIIYYGQYASENKCVSCVSETLFLQIVCVTTPKG